MKEEESFREGESEIELAAPQSLLNNEKKDWQRRDRARQAA